MHRHTVYTVALQNSVTAKAKWIGNPQRALWAESIAVWEVCVIICACADISAEPQQTMPVCLYILVWPS